MNATRPNRRVRLLVVLCVALAAGSCSGDGDGTRTEPGDHGSEAGRAEDWSYDDVEAWEETCATGREQSPVDLAGATSRDLPDLGFAYRPAPATVVDNGHTVQASFEGAGSLELDGETFELRQLHFHSPSEHLVAGASYAAEVHLVHEGTDGRLAVVAVLVEEGSANPVVAALLDQVPAAGAEPVAADAPVDPARVLPADRRAFRYDGSLTTPPCTEGVAWSVLAEPITWSAGQLAEFAERHPDSHRPPQPLDGRVLLHDER